MNLLLTNYILNRSKEWGNSIKGVKDDFSFLGKKKTVCIICIYDILYNSKIIDEYANILQFITIIFIVSEKTMCFPPKSLVEYGFAQKWAAKPNCYVNQILP